MENVTLTNRECVAAFNACTELARPEIDGKRVKNQLGGRINNRLFGLMRKLKGPAEDYQGALDALREQYDDVLSVIEDEGTDRGKLTSQQRQQLREFNVEVRDLEKRTFRLAVAEDERFTPKELIDRGGDPVAVLNLGPFLLAEEESEEETTSDPALEGEPVPADGVPVEA